MVSIQGADSGRSQMTLRPWIGSLFASAAFVAAPAHAQDASALYQTYCATCHEAGGGRAPNRDSMRQMTAEHNFDALKNGSMKAQAAERSRVQRRVLAEYLSGKKITNEPAVIPASAFCRDRGGPFLAAVSGPTWNGWGTN